MSDQQPATTLATAWSPLYCAAWDATPEAYVTSGVVQPGRSRRLARFTDAALHLTSYLGVQDFDPARWGLMGEARTRFFLSVLLDGRTISLHTYATLPEALAELEGVHMALALRATPAE